MRTLDDNSDKRSCRSTRARRSIGPFLDIEYSIGHCWPMKEQSAFDGRCEKMCDAVECATPDA